MNATIKKCMGKIQQYGFEIENDVKGLYNLIDIDYHQSKACCVPYQYKDYSKYNLTMSQVIKYTNYVYDKLSVK